MNALAPQPNQSMLELSSARFNYTKGSKTFTADVSDFRVSDPTRHTSFKIRSINTGVTVEYKLVDVSKNKEDDIQYWEYQPTELAARRNHHCKGTRVLIFND